MNTDTLLILIVIATCSLNIGIAAEHLSKKHYYRFGFAATIAIWGVFLLATFIFV